MEENKVVREPYSRFKEVEFFFKETQNQLWGTCNSKKNIKSPSLEFKKVF